jgi:hypothetical protein
MTLIQCPKRQQAPEGFAEVANVFAPLVAEQAKAEVVVVKMVKVGVFQPHRFQRLSLEDMLAYIPMVIPCAAAMSPSLLTQPGIAGYDLSADLVCLLMSASESSMNLLRLIFASVHAGSCMLAKSMLSLTQFLSRPVVPDLIIVGSN